MRLVKFAETGDIFPGDGILDPNLDGLPTTDLPYDEPFYLGLLSLCHTHTHTDKMMSW
jgi:hypothetical protein